MKKNAVLFFLMLFTIVFVLTGCAEVGFGPSTGVIDDTVTFKVDVLWYEINPPPGVSGPCYAYFQDKSEIVVGVANSFGYSGVYCK